MDCVGKPKRSRWLAIAGISLGALASSACFITAEPQGGGRSVEVESNTPQPAKGTLILRWTIDGRAEPNECVKSTSTQIELSIVDERDHEVGAWRQQCKDFKLSIKLDQGEYAGKATLLDSTGKSRTTSAPIDRFSLRGNDTIEVPVDFPGSSFR